LTRSSACIRGCIPEEPATAGLLVGRRVTEKTPAWLLLLLGIRAGIRVPEKTSPSRLLLLVIRVSKQPTPSLILTWGLCIVRIRRSKQPASAPTCIPKYPTTAASSLSRVGIIPEQATRRLLLSVGVGTKPAEHAPTLSRLLRARSSKQ
jgi:hypothetical protein